MVADRDHEPAAEARAQRTDGHQGVFADEEQTALAESLFGKLAFDEEGRESVVEWGGGADLELFGDLHPKAALFLPVGPHEGADFRIGAQGLVVVLGGELVEFENLLAQGALLTRRAAAAFLVFDRHAVALADGLHGLGEVELFGLADEGDDVAGLAAAEALEEAIVGVDVEGRRLFVVERTEAFEAPAGLAQGDGPGDDIHDVHTQLQVLDAGRLDDRHEEREPWKGNVRMHFQAAPGAVKFRDSSRKQTFALHD